MIEYNQRIRHAPGLYFAAGGWQKSGQFIYATGVAATPEGAQARCQSEYLEAAAILMEKQRTGFCDQANVQDVRGTAAAYSQQASIRRATHEAMERLAVQEWWFEGVSTINPSAELAGLFLRCQNEWKRENSRPASLLQLASNEIPPTFVAWSSCTDGREIVLGAACRPDPSSAVRAALREMIQMECGLEIIKFRDSANIALTETEIRIHDRAQNLKLSDCGALFYPSGISVAKNEMPHLSRNDGLQGFLDRSGLTMQRKMLPCPSADHYVACVKIMHRHTRAKVDTKGDAVWRSVQPY